MDALDPRHATEAGYEQHDRDHETACEPCHQAKLIASRRRCKRKTMGYRYTLPIGRHYDTLTTWRKNGASYGEIADHLGIEESRTWEIVDAGPEGIVYTRTYLAVARATGHPVTATGITRRVRALARLGYSCAVIANAAGTHPDTINDIRTDGAQFVTRKVRAGIVATYDRLHMTLPPTRTSREKAGVTRCRNYAEKQGWPPPLAFDVIDNANERPKGIPGTDDDTPHDANVVDRILAGDYRLKATADERREVIARWGGSQNELERLTGWNCARDKRTARAA